jgi:hypothetical protein
MKHEFFFYFFDKSSNIELDENPSSGSRIIPCGQTDGQTQREPTELQTHPKIEMRN